MGLRDRLKQQVQRAIGHTPAPPSPRPPRPPAVAPPAAPPAPKAAPPAPKAAPPAPKAPPPAPVAAPPAPSDAPVRQAHHRPDFVATALALRVRVHDPVTDAWLSFPCEPGETVLEAAERAGLVLPFSCRSGGCLSCTGLLQQGEAEQGDQYVLEEEQLQAGFRLLCCTTVRTDAVFLGHQEKNVQ